MDESLIEFYAIDALQKMLTELKHSEGLQHSKENCKILLMHALNLKKCIVRIISEIDKSCQLMSNVTLKKSFHETKGYLLNKTNEFSILFYEICDMPEDVIIHAELLLSFCCYFEELVANFREILRIQESVAIEQTSHHIYDIIEQLKVLNAIKIPDALEPAFSSFSVQIANLWPLLNKIVNNVMNDSRNITLDVAYRELKYMCSPLGKSLTMAIFHPSNKPLKDQKLAISQRVSEILEEFKSKLSISKDEQGIGHLTLYINEMTHLMEQFRNKYISDPANFLGRLKFYLVEIIKYAAIISHCPNQYQQCNPIAEAQIMLNKIGSLAQSLEDLDSSKPNERINYFEFCRSYELFLKKIECCYAYQVLEYYSDPLLSMKEVISSIGDGCSEESDLKETSSQCSDFCSNMCIMGTFAIAKSTPENGKTIIHLLNTLKWLDGLMEPCAMDAFKSNRHLLTYKIYARIWGDCAVKFCSTLDKLLDTRCLIHVAVLKFEDICNALRLIREKNQPDIKMASIPVMRASKLAYHLLLIQKVNPFYNSSHKLTFTTALRNLSHALSYWDGSAEKMLEAVRDIEQIHGYLHIMNNGLGDLTSANESGDFCNTMNSKDSKCILDESSTNNDISLDITCFLNSPMPANSLVMYSNPEFLLHMQNIKPVTEFNKTINNDGCRSRTKKT